MTFYLKRFVMVMASLAVLASTPGCAISKKECLQGDWQTVGYKDGSAGKSPDVITQYAKTCGKHGVTPDAAAYAAGFDAGIVLYCTPEKGFSVGESNGSYSGACPADLEKPFLKTYVDGLELALSELEIDYDRDRIEFDRLRDNRDRLASKGLPHETDDKRVKSAADALKANAQARSDINSKIRKWRSRF